MRSGFGLAVPLCAAAITALIGGSVAADVREGAEPAPTTLAPVPPDPPNVVKGSETYVIPWKMAHEIPVWKTVTLGAYATLDSLLDALSADDCGAGRRTTALAELVSAKVSRLPRCHLGVSAGAVIGHRSFRLSRVRQDVDLVVVSLRELGFAADEVVALEDVHDRADLMGYALCPPEAAALLRLNYLDQPQGESLHVMMQPVAAPPGKLTDLTVANEGTGLILIGGDAHPNFIVPATTRLVLIRPRP